MLTERTTTLFVSIFYFQKCQTRDYNALMGAVLVLEKDRGNRCISLYCVVLLIILYK